MGRPDRGQRPLVEAREETSVTWKDHRGDTSHIGRAGGRGGGHGQHGEA